MADELRYELKFTAPEASLIHLRSAIRLHPEGFRPAFGSRFVNSIYLDTPKMQAMNDNLSGIRQRRKIRVRWYGDLRTQIAAPVVELKIRDGYLGDKKRANLQTPLDLTQPWQQIMRQIRQDAVQQDEATWRKRLHPLLVPTIINCYKRDYFVSPDGQIRLTLDYQQKAYNQRLSLRPNLSFPVRVPPLLVVELKAPPELSERLETAASQLPIRRSRNSKYVNAMQSTPL